MARSKRIIVTICAVLITFVMCTVSANAMDIGSYGNLTNNLYKSTTPISNITFLQNTINTNEINYVSTTPMQSFNATSNEQYAFPDYIQTPILNNEAVPQFEIAYNFNWDDGDTRLISMEFNGLNTQYFGTTITSNNIEQRVLIAELKGGDFIFKRSMFDVYNGYVQVNWSEDNVAELMATNTFTITFLTTSRDADGNVTINPITIEGSELTQYGEVEDGAPKYATFKIAFSETAIDEAIRTSTVINDDIKSQLYNAEYFYVESFSTAFSVPENSLENYEFSINQTFIERVYPPQEIALYDYQFVNWVESLPTARVPDGNFDLLEVIMTNLDVALNIPIIDELTIGWIIWICVAIGALFGILKYFAGG